ncbi:MAG: hypothetical protein J6U64_03250, partial [Alphaproteobacteria bacterium]|nr:hypothetical protein [Alphaproteobacteria bacterium]
EKMGKCQKIDAKGCYTCVECPVPNPCPAPQCMNEEGVCCDSCPRVCQRDNASSMWMVVMNVVHVIDLFLP